MGGVDYEIRLFPAQQRLHAPEIKAADPHGYTWKRKGPHFRRRAVKRGNPPAGTPLGKKTAFGCAAENYYAGNSSLCHLFLSKVIQHKRNVGNKIVNGFASFEFTACAAIYNALSQSAFAHFTF
jgi:hypothetical protein